MQQDDDLIARYVFKRGFDRRMNPYFYTYQDGDKSVIYLNRDLGNLVAMVRLVAARAAVAKAYPQWLTA